jgi:xanthine/CO dehydrogenase XdhC/CoxF family maturation factor
LLGTIGGGAIEFEAVKAAEHIKGCEVRRFVLNNTDVGSLGMTCGGEAEILFERI